ncbi:cytoplasmic protein [Herbiconiux sp. VKM Ac-1786]|nr:cytoplasmic protein [Herbiconiux sp. VKM Ac-1786]
MDDDPTVTNPDNYTILWENEFVRVLDYVDVPGTQTVPHRHPNTVMVTLTDFSRRLRSDRAAVDTQMTAGTAVWLPAQSHWGENTGLTPTHVILVELKRGGAGDESPTSLGPETNHRSSAA